MKKNWKKAFCIVLALVMLTITAQPAFAATKYSYSTKTAEAGKTISGTNKSTYSSGTTTYKVTLYKITAPDNGYVTFNTYTTADGRDTYMYFFRSGTAAKAYDESYDGEIEYAYSSSSTHKKVVIPMEKGKTIFVRASVLGAYKFKYSFTKAGIHTSNLYRAKAMNVEAGAKKTVNIPDGYQGYRWYKFKVTTKKTVNINFKDMKGLMDVDYPDFKLFDSSGNRIKMVLGSGTNYKTAKQLPAGTYYIRVKAINDSDYSFNETFVYTFTWK